MRKFKRSVLAVAAIAIFIGFSAACQAAVTITSLTSTDTLNNGGIVTVTGTGPAGGTVLVAVGSLKSLQATVAADGTYSIQASVPVNNPGGSVTITVKDKNNDNDKAMVTTNTAGNTPGG